MTFHKNICCSTNSIYTSGPFSTVYDFLVRVPLLFGGGLLLLCTGCQVYNSSSGDEAKYGNQQANLETKSVASILQKHCGSCHSYSQKSLSQLVGDGLVVVGAPMSSPLYTRIRGSGSGINENMPQVGSSSSDLDASELTILRKWIETGTSLEYQMYFEDPN